MHPLHMSVFERISIEENMAMSVREAGIYTILALGEGAAAKGHNILEKTIKPGSLKAVYENKAGAALELAKIVVLLAGLAGGMRLVCRGFMRTTDQAGRIWFILPACRILLIMN